MEVRKWQKFSKFNLFAAVFWNGMFLAELVVNKVWCCIIYKIIAVIGFHFCR